MVGVEIGVAVPVVGPQSRACLHAGSHGRGQGLAAGAGHALQVQVPGVTVVVFDEGDHALFRGSAARGIVGALAPDGGVVGFNQPAYGSMLDASKDAVDVLADVVRGVRVHVQLAGQVGLGDALRCGDHVVDRQKPGPQIELRVLQDRAGGHAGLFAALRTLEQLAGFDEAPVLGFSTVGAFDPVVAPAGFAEELPALVFGSVLVNEFEQARRVAHRVVK
jgi:hypothetical protein